MNFIRITFIIGALIYNRIEINANIMTKSLKICKFDNDCGSNAYCKDNSFCTCKDGYFFGSNHQCLKEAEYIGENCLEDIQCTTAFGNKAECFKTIYSTAGKCQCMQNAHFEEGICHPTVLLGDYCQVSAHCKARSNISTFCDTGKCVCAFNYHPTPDRTDCIPSSKIGERCKNDEYCVTTNSTCNYICQCKSNYVISHNGKHCLLAASDYNQECRQDNQCQKNLKNSICDPLTKLCSCSIDARFKDGQCWRKKDLEETCADSRECSIASNNSAAVVCLNNKCECASGYKTNHRMDDCIRGSRSSATLNLTIDLKYSILLLNSISFCYFLRF